MIVLCRVLGFALLLFVLSTCSETSITQSDQDATVLVRGQVLAWYCYTGYPYGFQPSDLRYAVATGDRPQVSFLYPDGDIVGFRTDSLSGFARRIPKGATRVVVETRRTRPDTIICDFACDTTLSLEITYFVIDAFHITVSFNDRAIADSLGVDQEWQSIRNLSSALSGRIAVSELPQTTTRRTIIWGGNIDVN